MNPESAISAREDPWLRPWLERIRERAAGQRILEIGCGTGDDTSVLVECGAEVVAFDVSPQAAGAARDRVPRARVLCRDVRDPFPVDDASIGVVIASLSLHYFAWAETQRLEQRIRQALRPGGLLLCRVNSTHDRNHGACGHPEIEPGLFSVYGKPKRFFDRAALARLFADGWNVLGAREYVTDKYEKPKVVWELAAERDETPAREEARSA